MPIAIAAMAVGSLVQTYSGFEQAAAQRRMARAQQSQVDIETQNQRLEQVRQARIASARSIQMANNQGSSESSSSTTAASNFGQQAESNIGYLDSMQVASQNITQARVAMANAQGIGALGNGISNIGSVVAAHPKTFGVG